MASPRRSLEHKALQECSYENRSVLRFKITPSVGLSIIFAIFYAIPATANIGVMHIYQLSPRLGFGFLVGTVIVEVAIVSRFLRADHIPRPLHKAGLLILGFNGIWANLGIYTRAFTLNEVGQLWGTQGQVPQALFVYVIWWIAVSAIVEIPVGLLLLRRFRPTPVRWSFAVITSNTASSMLFAATVYLLRLWY